MAREIREMIVPDEELAARPVENGGNPEAVGGLKALVAHVDFARRMKWLRPRVLKAEQPKLIDESREGMVMPELEFVVGGQVNRMIRLGYHTEVYPDLSLEMAELQYRADCVLPEGADQPEDLAGRFDFTIVGEPRISLVRKHELAAKLKELNLDRMVRNWPTSRVAEYIDTGKIEDEKDEELYPTDVPYIFFTHDGQRHLGHSPKDGIKRFDSDEIGKLQRESTDHFMQKPIHFRRRGHDAVGSRYGGGRVPCLYAFDDGPEVDAGSLGYRFRGWGAASRGKEIIRLGA